MKKYNIIIGIDPGTKTGVAIFKPLFKSFNYINTLKIHEAIVLIADFVEDHPHAKIIVRIEDARTWKPFSKNRRESDAKKMGAGSIRRDCAIWEDFLADIKKEFPNVDYEFVNLQSNVKKLSADTFKRITGYEGKTTEHSRDAGILAFRK